MDVSDPARDERPEPDADLVSVFETTEASLLPLARAALEEAGIDYSVQNRGFADQLLGRRSSMTVGETDTPLHVVVRAEDAARARDLLRDLSNAPAVAASAAPAPVIETPLSAADAPVPASGEIEVSDAESGRVYGRLTRAQFDSLAAHLERESLRDDDFYIDTPTLAMLEDRGADRAAIGLLRHAIAGRSEVTIRWRDTTADGHSR